jgi:pimeloyl-ACP methyl ester carboxylesterase
MLEPDPQLIDVRDAQLAVREWGSAASPPVLFWHALGDHTSLQALELAPVLVNEYGLRVLGVDAPGFGASPRLPDERYAVPALVRLAGDLVEGLGFTRAAWMGSSWGAHLGVHVAAAYPDRIAALALLDGGYMDPRSDAGSTLAEQREHWRSQPELFRFPSWEAMLADVKPQLRRWSPGIEASLRSAYREENGTVVSIMGPDVYAAAIHGIDELPPSRALPELGRTDVPVLVLAATEPPEREQERSAALERFARTVPQGEIRRVDGAGHFVVEERPVEVAHAVGGWLAALPYA